VRERERERERERDRERDRERERHLGQSTPLSGPQNWPLVFHWVQKVKDE
jgi:hypothetical protein